MTAVLDYRSVLEEKLNAKRSELESTQENLKKYSLYVPPQQQQGHAGKNNSVFRNRLGPPAAAAAANGSSSKAMAGRLGPKVTASADKPKSGPGGSVLSRVIVEQKSRDEALAQQQKTTDKQEKMVSANMY